MIVFGSHFIRVFYLFIVIYSDIQNGVPVCIISSVICIFTQDMFDEYGFSTFCFCFCCIFCVWVQCLYFSFLSELLKSNAHYIYQSVYSSWSPICMIEKRMVRDQLQLNVSKRKKPFLHFISCTLSTFLDLPQDLTICVASLYQKLRNRDYEV